MAKARLPDLWDQPPVRKRRRGPFRPTSEDAGAGVPDETRDAQRRRILNVLWAYGPQTYQELADRAGVKLQSLCWRMKELRSTKAVACVMENGKVAKRGGGRLVEATYTPRERAS